MKLTVKNVNEVFDNCFTSIKDSNNIIIVNGIVNIFGFYKDKLELHKEDIESMLSELPEQFQEEKGGGWTFLNACDRKDGSQWTGEHRNMEMLFCMGIGLGIVNWLMPREMWSAFPGNMPYVVIKQEVIKEKLEK